MEAKITILNVDDFEAARYVKTRLLRNAGFAVLEASNGTDALEIAERLRPELVLLDVKLPDIDGRDVCRQMRAHAFMSTIPVVHTSAACITAADKARSLASGACAYLAAPFQPHELIQVIHTSLGTGKAPAPL